MLLKPTLDGIGVALFDKEGIWSESFRKAASVLAIPSRPLHSEYEGEISE